VGHSRASISVLTQFCIEFHEPLRRLPVMRCL
jgi:hypothetical protein